MKIKASLPTGESGQPDSIPFPEERIIRLLSELKVSLGNAEGRPLSYEDWGQITARPANTIASWSAGGPAHQLQVLFASLERLAEGERHRLIENACRDFPTLQHRKLAHDYVACSHLASLLRQPSGFTIIQGLDHLRTFLLHALGHSFGSINAQRRKVAGLDVHRPDCIVPVIGLVYLDNSLRSSDIHRQFERAWPNILAAHAGLLLINGAWRNVPELQPEILDAARSAHVVVADALTLKPNDLINRFPIPAHIISVAPTRERAEWIRVEIQAV